MTIVLNPTDIEFIDAVNRILRINGVIRGDDDAITTFSDTQHSGDIQIAQIAIQDELVELISDKLIPYEHTTGTITLSTSTRSYALASDFIRFFEPSFYDATDNVRYWEFKGGEQALMLCDYQYKTTEGSPMYWYWDNTNAKKVAFYNIPSASYNGRSLSYDYEKSVTVANSTDTLPFHNVEEYYAFCSMAARRMEAMMKGGQADLNMDPVYNSARARLLNLIRPTSPCNSYGKQY